MAQRNIIIIDEEKCDGCGKCAEACMEGAIQIINNKARLVSESYCDGLGACIGECPRGAITIEERDAEPFNPEAVAQHLQQEYPNVHRPVESPQHGLHGATCPGMALRMFEPADPHISPTYSEGRRVHSQLRNWPVQLRLVPVNAPFLRNANLLITADCVPCALPDFHDRFLAGRILLVGCPKLDDAPAYVQKLTTMFEENIIRSIEVLYMEVPCCFGLARLVQTAFEKSGKTIPITFTKISLKGEICERIFQNGIHEEISQEIQRP